MTSLESSVQKGIQAIQKIQCSPSTSNAQPCTADEDHVLSEVQSQISSEWAAYNFRQNQHAHAVFLSFLKK